MADLDCPASIRLVYQRLTQLGFRHRLTATAPDGSHPIVAMTREEPVSVLLDQVRAAGGASNVVIPALNGIVVVAVKIRDGGNFEADAPLLRNDCTVGVLLGRLRLDSLSDRDVIYKFAFARSDSGTDCGQAELVALGG